MKIKIWCGLVAALVLPTGVYAQSGAVFDVPANRWVDITFGKGYTVQVNGSPATPLPAGPSVVQASGGRALITTPAKVVIGGKEVGIFAKVKPAMAATGKLAVALAKVAGPVGVAVTAYELFSAVKDYSVQYRNPGLLDITKFDQGLQAGTYWRYIGAGLNSGYRFDTWELACADFASYFPDYPDWQGSSGPGQCNVNVSPVYWWSPIGKQAALSAMYIETQQSIPHPATEQQLIAAIESETGLSNGSVEGTIKAGLESGLDLETDPATTELSGPSTTGSPTVSKKTNPDGSVETTTTTNNITYQGNNIKVDTSTVVTNYNPVTNTTTTTSSTVTENPKLPEPEKITVTDSAFGEIPKLYTPKYPNGLTGVWAEKKSQLTNSSLMGLTATLMPDIAESGGSCPSWILPLDLASWAPYGDVDVSPPCWIWSAVKAFVIVGALLLARALVFGG